MDTTELKKLSTEIDKYKDLYNEMCNKYDTCGQCDDIYTIKCMSSHSNLICSEIYVALILLKDV